MSSEGYPRRTLHLPHSDTFAKSIHYMNHNDRAHLSYEKAKAIGLSYGASIVLERLRFGRCLLEESGFGYYCRC